MSEKGEKKLCWNCDGYVGVQLSECPYCAAPLKSPVSEHSNLAPEGLKAIKKEPVAKDFSVSQQEWEEALSKPNAPLDRENEKQFSTKKEMAAFLLLLPGVVFFLFGLALVFFSNDGILRLQWNQSFAYFYLLGAAPLLYLGWRTFR